MSKTTDAIQHRTTDWLKMDSLNYLADQHGMAVMSFSQNQYGWMVSYFKPNKRTQPVETECRDRIDYDLKLKAWMKECTIDSKQYYTFQEMVMGEIDRLKKAL